MPLGNDKSIRKTYKLDGASMPAGGPLPMGKAQSIRKSYTTFTKTTEDTAYSARFLPTVYSHSSSGPIADLYLFSTVRTWLEETSTRNPDSENVYFI